MGYRDFSNARTKEWLGEKIDFLETKKSNSAPQT